MNEILVVEDYASTRKMLAALLKKAGYVARFAKDGEEALVEFRKARPNLLLLDVMMPKRSGYEVLSEIRRDDPSLPVIMLSAKGGGDDIVLGLGLGADDYVSKPFDPPVLLARIASALRRASTVAPAPAPVASVDSPSVIDLGGASVDVLRHRLTLRNGKVVDLGARELEVLRVLAERRGMVVTRDELLDRVWGRDGGSVHSLDQLMLRLRRKLGRGCDKLISVYGVGYRFEGA